MKKSITIKTLLITVPCLLWLIVLQAQPVIITQWDFNYEVLIPNIGEGTAVNIGGTTYTWAAGVTGNPDRGWNTTDYPEQGTLPGTAGVEFYVSTVGYENIAVDLYHRSSGTASRWSQFEYTLNGGTDWNIHSNNEGALSPHDTFYPFSIDFTSVSGVSNNPDFGFRIVSIFSPVAFTDGLGNSFGPNEAYHRARVSGGNVYAPGGTWRFDDVTLSGTVLVGISEVNDQMFSAHAFGGQVFLDTKTTESLSFIIYNLLGQPVLMKELNGSTHYQINHYLTPGAYIIHLQNPGTFSTRKILVQ